MEQKRTVDIENPAFYTVVEFAAFLRMSTKTILRAINKGKINAVNMGTKTKKWYRIPASELNRMAVCDFQEVVNKMVEEHVSGLK
jgi:excisionase family DNA binding protein